MIRNKDEEYEEQNCVREPAHTHTHTQGAVQTLTGEVAVTVTH